MGFSPRNHNAMVYLEIPFSSLSFVCEMSSEMCGLEGTCNSQYSLILVTSTVQSLEPFFLYVFHREMESCYESRV